MDNDEIKQILDTLNDKGPMAPQELIDFLKKQGLSESSAARLIWHLVARAWIGVDRNMKLDIRAKIINKVPDGEETDDDFGGYVHNAKRIPTIEEAYAHLGIIEKDRQFSREGIRLLNKRALNILDNAVLCAYATLKAIIRFYPEEYRKNIELVLNELALAYNQILDDFGMKREGDNILELRISIALAAVGHSGNIFNNTTHLLPKEVRKAVLESRDLCDEAVRQPYLI